eukprot:7074716-Heterocapsa_arctica.AAC.1
MEPSLDLDLEDIGYIEATSTESKTSNTARRRRRNLPVVGHAAGLDGKCWAKNWLKERREQGLDAAVDGCLMPVPARGGGWTKRRLTSGETA